MIKRLFALALIANTVLVWLFAASIAFAAPPGEYNRTNLDRAEWDNYEVTGEKRVMVADQTSPTIIVPLINKVASTTLNTDGVLGEYTIDVVSSAGFAVGQYIRILDSTNNRFYSGKVLVINVNTITLDTQLDFAFAAGSQATVGSDNMAVDGSVTPVVFELRIDDPPIEVTADITRMIISCETATAVALNKFGDLTALTRGISFRRQNGTTNNIFNVKTNGEIKGICYDYDPTVASNPAQAVDGFHARLTFAGQNKIGVALRIEPNGNLQMIVQDDLTGLVFLGVIVEGHVVVD